MSLHPLIGLAGAPEAVSTALYVAAILVGGYFFGREALEELIFEREIGIELLMSMAAIVAAVLGQVGEGAMLVFLYSISEAAEGYTEEKTRSAVKALMNLAPKIALVRRDGAEREIPVEELVVGDVFIVKPGQALATDGVVLVGSSSVNQAPVTGESVPVEKRPGDTVFAGSINGEGALEVRATKTFADNTIARIIHMVEEAQEKKGKSQRFIERFGARVQPGRAARRRPRSPSCRRCSSARSGRPGSRAPRCSSWRLRRARSSSRFRSRWWPRWAPARGTACSSRAVSTSRSCAKVKVVALDKTGTLTRGEPK